MSKKACCQIISVLCRLFLLYLSAAEYPNTSACYTAAPTNTNTTIMSREALMRVMRVILQGCSGKIH